MGKPVYAIGLDFGTNSARAVIVDTATGEMLSDSVWPYARGDSGILLDNRDPNLARQHPADYVEGIEHAVKQAIRVATANAEFSPEQIIGIGVDTTGSTPIPLSSDCVPLALHDEFKDDLNAMAWLWKDHTAHAEAAEITSQAAKLRPQYLTKCGGTYSSEWFWSKALHCIRVAPKVFAAADTWVECADWIPACLAGITHSKELKRGICAAGHKAMFHPAWGGYPDAEFLASLDESLATLRDTLPDTAVTIADSVGYLTKDWAARLGLRTGIPIAVGAIDAHLGAVGSGIRPGTMVKILGTSSCDMMVAPLAEDVPDIPGLCGIVPESILPGHYGFEAGQAAVGDIFNWFVNYIRPDGMGHEALTAKAEQLKPGESGLLALDWNNGNRTVLVDQRLTGLVLGMTLQTKPEEIYRALIEATAFGARIIADRFEAYGNQVERIVNCGGISVKNPMVMQIYADIMGRPLDISSSTQTCALGAAMAGAVVAGKSAGGHADFEEAIAAMTGIMNERFRPRIESQNVYSRLYQLYREVHDAFGTRDYDHSLFAIMKELLEIRDHVRG